jgi:hypothetical protein
MPISRWRYLHLAWFKLTAVFEKGGGPAEKPDEALTGELYKKIGQLKVENDFLSRKLGH